MAIPIPESRIARFENMGFGMFIHYGIYSQLGCGEWVMDIAQIPKEEYVKLADTFTAKDFDAKAIARTAKAAGMNYITLTTKHHDGFCLYDTKGLCDYDAPHSACGRDLIREFVDACNEEGIMPMFYHATLEWYHEEFETDFPKYLQYLRDSVEILCTQYGKIGGLWFDGNWSKPAGTDWEEDKLYEVIRRHQPDAIIVNNTGLDARGAVGNPEIDSVTFEQGRPSPMDREGMPKYLAAEMCHTMNDHWGFGKCDLNYKSLPDMIETLCACRKVGANYLLNVGPEGDGKIPDMQKTMIEAMGTWIKECGNIIYEGKPSKIEGEYKNFALEANGKAYLFIHGLNVLGSAHVIVAGGGLGYKYFKKVNRKVKSAKWTDNGENLEFVQNGEHLWVNATGFPYGCNFVVRVMEIEFED
ncbi:MAG: alpha-L-fucosidase [Clostridia bacterium]|nr:alpha-L-fucosidase [Clostridia bacterium]